jgi:hypothetical protein
MRLRKFAALKVASPGSESPFPPGSKFNRGKETTMRFNVKTISFALALIAGVAALALSLSKGVMAVSAFSAQNGQLHATKDCAGYKFLAGQSCTIKYSNLGEIKVGSTVFYDQDANTPLGLLDSNVVLDAGYGNRALGRCTLDFATGLGLCTFSDGTGQFAGFQARVDVSPPRHNDPYWHWDGTYSFNPLPPR